jgi:hypothetical protein
MGTAIEDLLRLAWEADGAGKPGLRDALMTLAVLDSGKENAVLAERCRRLLVARRPDHWFATSPTLGQAMANGKVAAAIERLRLTFPPVRVQWHLTRSAVLRGPYTGRNVALSRVLEDLSLSGGRRNANGRANANGNGSGAHALPFPGSTGGPERPAESDPDGSLAALYLTVLLAMAVLLKGVIEADSRDNTAA